MIMIRKILLVIGTKHVHISFTKQAAANQIPGGICSVQVSNLGLSHLDARVLSNKLRKMVGQKQAGT